MPTSYEASTQIIIAINLRAALTSNSEFEQQIHNSAIRRKKSS